MVRGSLVWVSLDPARGSEVPKTRPCIVVSRTEANDISSTVTIVHFLRFAEDPPTG